MADPSILELLAREERWRSMVAIAFIIGLLLGRWLFPSPYRESADPVLGKTDGVICFASADGLGVHWLAKNGICYAADNPSK